MPEMMERNPFVGIKEEPITRNQVNSLRNELLRYWEDTVLVTKPNSMSVITVGNLRAIVETLLALMPEKREDA